MTIGTGLASLDGATTVVDGAAFVTGSVNRESFALQVDGMVTNDIVQVEASNDGGTTWTKVGDDITADGIYSVEAGAERYRANLTDVSGGGTVTAIFFGGY